MTPNAHRVKSWLGYRQPPWDSLPIDYGESLDQIARYIWENYGVKTVLADVSIMASMTTLSAEYYIRPSDNYRLSEEESRDLYERNIQIIQDYALDGKGRGRRVRYHHT